MNIISTSRIFPKTYTAHADDRQPCRQVRLQHPTSADNVSLLAFAAERRPRAASDRYLPAAWPTAANPPQRPSNGIYGRTNGQTEGRWTVSWKLLRILNARSVMSTMHQQARVRSTETHSQTDHIVSASVISQILGVSFAYGTDITRPQISRVKIFKQKYKK